VEIVSERDAELLDDLRELVEAKRRELRNSGSRSAEDSSRSKDKA
jgi:hypothetical protein